MHLKTLLMEPPGGWIYRQPETGLVMKDITFGMLVQRVQQHRTNQKIETKSNLAAEVEAAICAALSPEDQVTHCTGIPTGPRTVHWSHIESFLKTLAAFVVGPDPLVSQEEADRRASICARCPMNVGMHGCAMCRSALDALREKLTTRRTALDDQLKACGWCSCDNRAQVHVPLSALAAGKKSLPLPPTWCWQHPDAQTP